MQLNNQFQFQHNWTAHVWEPFLLAPYQGWKNLYFNFSRNKATFVKRHTRHHLSEIFSVLHFVKCFQSMDVEPCFSNENTSTLRSVTINFTRNLQPTKVHLCSMLLLLNLAQADWVSVDCHQKILSHIVCFFPAKDNETATDYIDANCNKFEIFFASNCYSFFWNFGDKERATQSCNNSCFFAVFSQTKTFSVFHLLLTSTSLTGIKVASPESIDMKQLKFYVIKRYWLQTRTELSSNRAGLFACFRPPSTQLYVDSDSLVKCVGGYFMSTAFICKADFSCKIDTKMVKFESELTKCKETRTKNTINSSVCFPLLYKGTDETCQTFLRRQILYVRKNELSDTRYICSLSESVFYPNTFGK